MELHVWQWEACVMGWRIFVNIYGVWGCVGSSGTRSFVSYEKYLDGAMCVSDVYVYGEFV